MTLTELLSSAVLSAVVAALVSLRSAERSIEIGNITQERAKWREKIRETSLKVHQAASNTTTKEANEQLAELRLVFELLLNPLDPEDIAILDCIDGLRGCAEPEKRLPEFSKRVAYLLKHDWERAKREAKPWWGRSFKKPLRQSLG